MHVLAVPHFCEMFLFQVLLMKQSLLDAHNKMLCIDVPHWRFACLTTYATAGFAFFLYHSAEVFVSDHPASVSILHAEVKCIASALPCIGVLT